MYLGTNSFPTTWENGTLTSSFVFRLPTTSEIEIQILILDFRFPSTNWNFYFPFRFSINSYNRIEIAIQFPPFFIFELRFSFLVFMFYYVMLSQDSRN